ncbi:PHB depolymerase family esterase [Cellulosimicrobium terreum]|nr:PHB depolymerase family esterase [Cellulosimicrobium terreum]
MGTTGPRPRHRRGRRPWVVGALVALAVAASIAATLVFQLGWPWDHGDGDRNHLYRAADGTWQHYQVHVPPQHGDGVALPVMMALHGCGMTGFGWNSMKATTQFNELADEEGFLVVYPSQRPFENLINCWDAADPRNQQRGEGEPALLAGIAGEVVDTYGADPSRVHVSGASSGAGAAVVLAATYPDVFATATSVAGAEYGANQVDPSAPDEVPARATARQAWAQMGDRAREVPMLVVQGGQDEVVRTFVGERLVEHWRAVNDLVDDGALNDSLGLSVTTEHRPATGEAQAHERTVYTTPDGSILLEYVFVPDLDHAWPGPDGEGTYTDARGPDAARLSWRFAQHHDLGRG